MTNETETIVSLARAIVDAVETGTDYSHLQLEDHLTKLIHTLLQSSDANKRWAGLMAVDRSVEKAVRAARERGMTKAFVGSLLGSIQLASM